mgnify:CR=1 FL=1
MTTKNIVPRATGEGNIGTSAKHWLKGWFDNIFLDNAGDITDGITTMAYKDLQILSSSRIGTVAVADQTVLASTTALIAGSKILVPSTVLWQPGLSIRWAYTCSKTAGGTALNTWLVKIGVNGSTADSTVATFATGLGTGVADAGKGIIVFTVRTIGATATAIANFTFYHNLAATGFLVIPVASIGLTKPT